MGYRSDFRLESYHSDETKKRIFEWLETKDVDLRFCIERLLDDNALWEAKWYDHEEDMIELSKAFPNEKFIIGVQGEEPDDKWCSYSWHGECRVVHASIVWPGDPFDEEADE